LLIGLPDFNYTNEKPDAAVGLALLNRRQFRRFSSTLFDPCCLGMTDYRLVSRKILENK
jgi:hypothetical protein